MPRPFDDLAFRAALGRFATGVIVLSTGPRPRPHAMTANAFMSGSLEPPLVVVSVGKRARMHGRLGTARRFGISILDQAQEPASRHFAGQAVPGTRGPDLFDAEGACNKDAISCLIGTSATDAHVAICNSAVLSASDLDKGKAIAVATMLSAAHSCD